MPDESTSLADKEVEAEASKVHVLLHPSLLECPLCVKVELGQCFEAFMSELEGPRSWLRCIFAHFLLFVFSQHTSLLCRQKS